ncbi:MAG: hypothetical protein KDE22_15850 [Rhodobacterales bacterium]|nr:hypothetical protein [Rhodobacterales bacterium]
MQLERKPAFDIPPGHAVLVERGDACLVCLKAEREGKEYVHHYVVPLDPRPGTAHDMIYVDPDDVLVDCGARPAIVLEAAAEGLDAGPGDIFRTARGTFIKVIEDPKTQKMFGYVDVATGRIERRRERGLEAVYRAWRVDGLGDMGAITLDTLRAALARL